jgi:succinate dehydrogenase / fumarate reductase flavoprotein subunit
MADIVDTIDHDILILGSGLAGLRAGIEAARTGEGKLSVAVISKLQLMRSHSVAAEGGTAAVLRPELGDSIDLHAWDTVKGSDFLADQDVVYRFVKAMPGEILQLEHWGIPWSRTKDGRVDQRPFGGHSYPRATYAADKTGFFEMQTLYDTLLKYPGIHRYDEYFVTSILVEEGRFSGLCAIDMSRGRICHLRGKALIIATGGGGRLYGFTTYSHSVTGDGLAMAYRAGIALEDIEFIQFHPTGLVPSGILITEATRGEGGYLLNAEGKRFMEDYAASKMELAPRDIVSRSEMKEIEAGRGVPDPGGLDYVYLDLTHLGADKINERLPLIREVCIKFNGIDPITDKIPIRPVSHYWMGGIETDIDGKTSVEGIWAAGEAMCSSLHGANRLGSNSTAECLVWGGITGGEAARHCLGGGKVHEPPKAALERATKRVRDLLAMDGDENPFMIRREMRETMDKFVGVFRTGEELREADKRIRALKKRFGNIGVRDKSMTYNTNLTNVMEIGFMLDLCEVLVRGAILREESRGGHARRDFPDRDDEKWLKHTLAFMEGDGEDIRFEYKPVTITSWKPVERKY